MLYAQFQVVKGGRSKTDCFNQYTQLKKDRASAKTKASREKSSSRSKKVMESKPHDHGTGINADAKLKESPQEQPGSCVELVHDSTRVLEVEEFSDDDF